MGVKEIYEFGRIVLDVIVAEALNGNYLFLVAKSTLLVLIFYTKESYEIAQFNFELDHIISYSLHFCNIL